MQMPMSSQLRVIYYLPAPLVCSTSLGVGSLLVCTGVVSCERTLASSALLPSVGLAVACAGALFDSFPAVVDLSVAPVWLVDEDDEDADATLFRLVRN